MPELWLPCCAVPLGRLAVAVAVRPWVPAVGLVLVLGRAVVLAVPVLPVAMPDMLPVVGRDVVAVLFDRLPPVRPELALAPPCLDPSVGTR